MGEFKVLAPGHGELPEVAFIDNPVEQGGGRRYGTDAQVLKVKRGESGFYPVYTRISADDLNEQHGVTPAQREAMLIGSMMGWTVPGANPDFWVDQLASAAVRP